MSLAVSLQHRLDALRKKCSTGYGCGSACINLRKECRVSPRSAIGKQRMKRLLELAAGGASSQRGIAPLRGKEAGELAGAIGARRGEKAAQLRSGRQQVAAEKAKAAEAAAKASSSTSGKAPAGSPRSAADTLKGSGDYEFARDSAVQNAGEDIALSARHKRNMFRTIEEAEASGQVEKILTRDILMKNFPTDLVSGVNESNVLARLEAYYSLKAFPNLSAKDVDSYIEGVTRRERNSSERERATGRLFSATEQAVDAKAVRKQYFDSFQEVRSFIEENKDMPPGKLRMALGIKVGNMIDRIRGGEGTGYTRTYKDPFNPAANGLVAMQKRLRMSGRSTSTVYGQMNEFAKFLKTETGLSDAGKSMARAVETGTKIMEGASVGSAFGKEGGGKKRFSAADLYVAGERRVGGRSVGGTAQAATDTIVSRLGFRGLQYGNSVTDDERRHHVQKAAEAMVDLADMTGLPDRAVGLNGTLGLAIGARGRGGAMAHFEPDMKVINLTRKNGVGTFAHEWAHALDNYAAGGTGFVSQSRGTPDLIESMRQVQYSMIKSGFADQVQVAVRTMKKDGFGISADYWTSREEMFARAFEAHVQLKLGKAKRVNTYLTQPTGHELWPTRKQAEEMEPLFDALLARVKAEKFPGPNNRGDSREQRIQRLVQEAYQAAAAEHRADASLRQRIDAVKRKCTTGYSCGAGCISMNKQCRKTPSAGPAQQKMTRILALAQPGETLAPPAADSPTQQPRQAASRPTKPTAQQKPSTTNKTPTAKPKGRALAGLQSSADYEQTIRSSATDAAAVGAHKAARALDNTSRGQSRKAFETEMGGRNQASQAITEITNFTGLNYSAIRAAQRNDASVFKDQAQMEEYSGKAATIEKAVRSMPKPDVTKYRGITASDSYLKQLVAKAEAGGTLKNDALDSWSTSLRIADDFSKKYADHASPNAVVFRAQNKTGASVKAFSAAKQEDEILTPSGSSYRITGYRSIVQGGKSVHIFDLEET